MLNSISLLCRAYVTVLCIMWVQYTRVWRILTCMMRRDGSEPLKRWNKGSYSYVYQQKSIVLVIVCSLDIYNNCCSSKTSFMKAAVWHSSTETALEPSGNTSLIALFIWMNKQWATYPWKKGKPLHKTHFVQYQASSPGLGWLGDGDCYLMHKVQSDSWLYPIETLQGSFSL